MNRQRAIKAERHGLEVIERPSSWKEDRNGAVIMAGLTAVVGIASFTWGGPAPVTALASAASAFCIYLAVVAHRHIDKP